jgi:hypothetical protein
MSHRLIAPGPNAAAVQPSWSGPRSAPCVGWAHYLGCQGMSWPRRLWQHLVMLALPHSGRPDRLDRAVHGGREEVAGAAPRELDATLNVVNPGSAGPSSGRPGDPRRRSGRPR